MPARRIRAVGGLATDPSALTDPEALRVADNVLLHRPGIIQPRFGFGDTSGVAARSVTRRPIAIVPFDGDLVIQSRDGSTYSLERGSVATVYSTDVAPPDTTLRGVSSFAEARGSLYLTTDDGVKKLVDIVDTSIDLAGVATEFHALTATLTAVLASASASIDRYAIRDDGAAAYRYVWRRHDANGYIRRSAPSARFVIAAGAASGGPWNAELSRLSLPSGIVTGDYLELYRTEGVTPLDSTPGREYYLALEYQVTAADVAAGYIAAGALYDDTPDSALGAALYTNPSQGGIDQANEVPPLANCMAWWGDVMWFGNTQSRNALEVELVNVGSVAVGNRARTGLASHALTGSFSSGSASFTFAGLGITPHGLKVGQYVSDDTNGPTQAGTVIQALSKISTLTTTIQVNNATLAADDTITVFGETFTWKVAAGADDEITIGATSILSAGNLAAKLDGWDFAEPVNVSASNGGSAAVDATELVHGLLIVADVTGTGQTVGYSGTMTKTASDTDASVDFRSFDFVTINSVEFYAGALGTYGVGAANSQYRLFGVSVSVVDFNSRIAITLDQLAHAVNAYTIEQDASFGVLAYRDVEDSSPWTDVTATGAAGAYLTLIRSTMALGTFSFSCTVRPDAFRPNTGTAGSITSESTRARNRIYFSKIDEPEAVPTLNFLSIGRRDADILALVPLENALIVFKEDGIFSISGVAPNAWSVDEINLEMRLLAPQAVCALGGIVYAWTDRGVVGVTEVAARALSQQIGDQLREVQRLLPLNESDVKRGFWMAAHRRHGLVVLGTGDDPADDLASAWYVFHTSTGRWARWPIVSRSLAYDPARDAFVHALGAIDGWHLHYERANEDEPASYLDASLAPLTGSVSGAVVTIAISEFGDFAPAAGDVIVGGANARRIVDVTSGGGNYTLTVDSAGLTGTAFGWGQGIACTLLWQAQNLPGIGSRWTEMHMKLGKRSSEYVATWPLSIGGLTDGSDVAVVTPDITPGDDDLPSKVVRVGPPRDIVRANDLYPVILETNAGVLWELLALDLHFTPQRQRVAR
jgi:hypothetical protein